LSPQFEYDVFLSHSDEDKPIVRKLAEKLAGDGLRVWLDEQIIRPGDSIPLAVKNGLTPVGFYNMLGRSIQDNVRSESQCNKQNSS
jgi:hypothetical protein